jgi:adenylyltransferase/sulfurtransferase
MANPKVPGITPEELKRRLDAGEQIDIIDVREPHEHAKANLADRGARLIPVDQLPQRLAEIDRNQVTVFH